MSPDHGGRLPTGVIKGSAAPGQSGRFRNLSRRSAVTPQCLNTLLLCVSFPPVRTVQEIERAAEQLPPEDFAKLAAWINRRQAEAWDREIEADAKAGRLDKFVDEALEVLRGGQTTPAP